MTDVGNDEYLNDDCPNDECPNDECPNDECQAGECQARSGHPQVKEESCCWFIDDFVSLIQRTIGKDPCFFFFFFFLTVPGVFCWMDHFYPRMD